MKQVVRKQLVSLSKKSILFKKLLRKVLYLKGLTSYLYHYLLNKTNDKIIILEAYMGRSYACSPKALYENMINNDKYKDYTFIWAFTEPDNYKFLTKNKNTKIIEYKSKEYNKYYSTAKYWITNSRLPEYIIKRKDQIYVQCWHGTPLKRLGYDIITETKNALNTKNELLNKYDQDAKRYNYMLSPSKFCTDKFNSAFNLKKLHNKNIIIEEGYPRNEFLYNYKTSDVKKIKTELKIPKTKKVILYAPTWRDDQHTSGVGYTYKTEVDFDYLKKELQEDYIILFRAHYFVANSFDFEKYKEFVYDVSKIDDINDLYIISDILITDYSSVFFDYANLKRPMIFYMYDLDYYEKELRGFYIDLKELPGNIVKTEKELLDVLLNIEKHNKKQQKTFSEFNNKYNYLDDGKASERVLEKIKIGESV